MRYLLAAETAEAFSRYQEFASSIRNKLDHYLSVLQDQYAVREFPGTLVLTSSEAATQLLSNIPVPAYTNEWRTVFCPELPSWRRIYLHQLDEGNDPDIQKYYENALTENHILQILGHEFVHHSDLFIDEAWEIARWFEEGMCEYISRKYFLTGAEFEDEARINELLVKRYEERYGIQSPESFCRDTYSGSLEDIFYFYWKSFLAVQAAVQKFGSVEAVFREYLRWFREEPTTPLSVWFRI